MPLVARGALTAKLCIISVIIEMTGEVRVSIIAGTLHINALQVCVDRKTFSGCVLGIASITEKALLIISLL